jgi:signal transduction histidine kinase
MRARLDRRGDGHLQDAYLEVVLQPLPNTQGGVDGIFVYAVEVTEYVRARQGIEELDRLKEEFIATASHDLKSPLTSIRGYAQLLLRRVRAPQLDLDQMAQALVDAAVRSLAGIDPSPPAENRQGGSSRLDCSRARFGMRNRAR